MLYSFARVSAVWGSGGRTIRRRCLPNPRPPDAQQLLYNGPMARKTTNKAEEPSTQRSDVVNAVIKSLSADAPANAAKDRDDYLRSYLRNK